MPRFAVRDAGYSLVGDSNIEYLEIPYDAGTFDISTSDFSFACWIKFLPNASETQPAFFGIDDPVASDSSGFHIRYRRDGGNSSIQVILNNGSGAFGNTSWSLITITGQNAKLGDGESNWHFFAFSFDRDGSANFWFDGVSQGAQSIASKDGSISTSNLILLNGDLGTFKTAFARMNGAWVWNTLIDQADVDNLYYNNQVEQTGLIGEWLMTEGSGADVADTSGQGNDGTITGPMVWSSDVPFYARVPLSSPRTPLSSPRTPLSSPRIAIS